MSKRLSVEAILFALFVGIHAALRYTNIAVQLAADVAVVTVLSFAAVAIFWALDLVEPQSDGHQRRLERWKSSAILLAIALLTILPTILMMVFRVRLEAPHSFSHDGLLQTEAAVEYVLHGKNPYVENYFGTPVEKWPNPFSELQANPPLYHYAYLPFTFLLPLPFQWLGHITLGWFDHRILFIFFLLAALLVGQRLITNPAHRHLWLIMIGLSPLFVPSFIEGRNDIMLVLAVVLITALISKGQVRLSAFVLALTCAIKHFAWFLVPFYFLFVGEDGTLLERARRALKPFLIFALTFAVVMLPWLIWDFGAFWEDTFGYLSGANAAVPFPVAGFGFSKFLVQIGVIPSITDPFPHGIVQLMFGIPVFILLVRRQWKQNTWHQALIHYAMILFVFGYFSRIFFDNYLGYVIAIAATGALIDPVPPVSAPAGLNAP